MSDNLESIRLLNKAAEDMRIQKGDNEAYYDFQSRVIYSAIGNMAYASLWDQIDENDNTSLTHFKHRVKETIIAWHNALSDRYTIFGISAEDLADEILQTFENAGVAYRNPYRIAPAKDAVFSGENCTFIRSPRLNQRVFTSGLGFYSFDKVEGAQAFSDVFSIDDHSLKEIAYHYTDKLQFRPIQNQIDIEYCRLDRRTYRDYWKSDPDKDGKVSIMRTKDEFQSIYYFYKIVDDRLLVSQIPEWLCSNGMYRYLSTALMKQYGLLPEIEYSVNGSIVTVNQQYLLPPAELRMLRLYSWPFVFDDIKQSFKRIMTFECFMEMKEQLHTKGYEFKEV